MAADLRTQKRLERLRQQADALLELTQAINRIVEDEVLFALYRKILEAMGVGKLALFTRGPEEVVWGCQVEWGYPTRLPKLENANAVLSGKAHAMVAGDTEVEFDLAIPVEHDGDVIAYVVMGDREEGRGMSPSIRYVRFITTLTNVLVVALRNRALTAERIRTAGLERELALAGEMQSMLLPAVLPHDAHRTFAARYRPHHHVGGDYYDAVPLSDGRMAIAMADVSGKGMPAAFLMSNFQAHLHAQLEQNPGNLESMVRSLNERVFISARGERFITLFLAVHDPKRARITYVNCGHNPPLFVPDKGPGTFLGEGCPGLGMLDALPMVGEGTLDISAGSTLVCFTDGLVEQENVRGEAYGEHRLQQLVENERKSGAEGLNASIIVDWEQHRGLAEPADDTALLTIRFS
ncbi:MAG: PP2C family protein-serine/threonine phosphatase [Flavobacteriales bacterium]|nr:PP2C family protein-serine/threonine phosphatase [Flavobacteriales bacterium]